MAEIECPARRVVDKFDGGVPEVAAALGQTRAAIYAMMGDERVDCDNFGLFPAAKIPRLIAYGERRKPPVRLTFEEFFWRPGEREKALDLARAARKLRTQIRRDAKLKAKLEKEAAEAADETLSETA